MESSADSATCWHGALEKAIRDHDGGGVRGGGCFIENPLVAVEVASTSQACRASVAVDSRGMGWSGWGGGALSVHPDSPSLSEALQRRAGGA